MERRVTGNQLGLVNRFWNGSYWNLLFIAASYHWHVLRQQKNIQSLKDKINVAASYHWHISHQYVFGKDEIKTFWLLPHIIGMFLVNSIVFSLQIFFLAQKSRLFSGIHFIKL
jgi:hypothetical protein